MGPKMKGIGMLSSPRPDSPPLMTSGSITLSVAVREGSSAVPRGRRARTVGQDRLVELCVLSGSPVVLNDPDGGCMHAYMQSFGAFLRREGHSYDFDLRLMCALRLC